MHRIELVLDSQNQFDFSTIEDLMMTDHVDQLTKNTDD
jgi:hypothetical protein